MAETLSFLDRLRGKRGDIELPNESGKIDPKLARPDVRGQLEKAFQAAKDINSESNALKGLKKAGARQ